MYFSYTGDFEIIPSVQFQVGGGRGWEEEISLGWFPIQSCLQEEKPDPTYTGLNIRPLLFDVGVSNFNSFC